MKKFFEKAKKFFAENKVPVIITAAVVFAAILCFAFLGRKQQNERWPKNALTEGIPEFEGEIVSSYEGKESTAVYFGSVYRDQADAYAKKLEDELKIDFGMTDGYPVSAEYKNIIITLHYNASELEFSVTFSEKYDGKSDEEERQK